MATVTQIARRTFLFGSCAIAGGVAFGAYYANRPLENPLSTGLLDGEAAITPYVKITNDNITLITPRADKGQGSYSIQAYLIAEELDIDPRSAHLSPGLPHQSYYNGKIAAEGLPIAAYTDTQLANTLRHVAAIPAKLLSLQITGGSSSVPDMFTRLRMSGAIARETLKEAAAQRFDMPRASLSTRDGHVIFPDGSSVPYTELAADAAQIDPIVDVKPRDSSAWRYLGKSHLQRLDMDAKCTGTETYGIDLKFEGMLYATVRANPSIGYKVTSFDDTVAKELRGVKAVVPLKHGIGIIADNTWRAFKAAEALEIQWEKPDYPGSSAEIFAALENALDNPDAYDHRLRNDGDVVANMEEGLVLEANYRAPYLAHAPLEPMNAVVVATDDSLNIWTGTQIPVFVRDRAAEIAGIDAQSVFVHNQPMGGSFGHRLEMTHVEQAVELALSMKGAPIKMTWSREEDMTHDYPRPASVARARGRIENGKVDTIDLSVSQSAMTPVWFHRMTGRSLPGPDQTITTGSWDQPYAVPNYRVTGYRAKDMVPVSSWRSVGASANAFFHESFLDELIHAAGADPLEERLRLCSHDVSRRVLEAAGELSNWSNMETIPHQGRGLAFCMSFGVPVAQVIEITETSKGLKVDKVCVALDIGQVLDPMNVEAQVVGSVLFGLSHAIYSQLTYDNHVPLQSNFHDYESLRIHQTPKIEVRVLSNSTVIRGVGEPAVPPVAPALANAVFSATGTRIREMPFNTHVSFI